MAKEYRISFVYEDKGVTHSGQFNDPFVDVDAAKKAAEYLAGDSLVCTVTCIETTVIEHADGR